MAATMVRTRTPGVYKRGKRYAYTWRDAMGKQRWASARTYELARSAKAKAERSVHHGAPVLLGAFLREWVETYQGTGRRGFRDETRAEYRSIIEQRILPFFPPRLAVHQVTPHHVAQYIAHLCDLPNGRGGRLSDSTVRNNLNPLRAAMASAAAQGLIPADPTTSAQLPHRPRLADDEPTVRALSLEQLLGVIAAAAPDYQLMLWTLAMSGLRASELIGLDREHLVEGGLSVRQRYRKGAVGPVKSKHAVRFVPLPRELRARLERTQRPSGPLFQSLTGRRLDIDNVRNRVIRPAGERVGLPWIGWHTFRHTHASLRFANGDNIVTVQRVLGHHAASFTLDTYVHLLSVDVAAPLVL